EQAWLRLGRDPGFQRELDDLLRNYAGRPTPLTHARRLSAELGCDVWLKREDLLHTGAHKINNTLGQCLLATKMGKRRIVAETGAGQHGVASATAAALFGLECIVYMGTVDAERQRPNVLRIELVGVEAGGEGVDTGRHAARFAGGSPGVLHGCHTYLLQDAEGQIRPTHSISAGLDYPAIGPEHAALHDAGRAYYTACTDDDALRGFELLAKLEGILPALESAHAIG